MKNVVILGCTGSVGSQSLEVIEQLEDYRVVGLSAQGTNVNLLKEQIKRFSPKVVSVGCEETANLLSKEIKNVEFLFGTQGNCYLASLNEADIIIIAIAGMIALEPTLEAIRSKKIIGLSNKEIIVSAGEYIVQEKSLFGATIIPIDSEHSAIFQCLSSSPISEVRRLILTASGGPFLHRDVENITFEDVFKHPTWKMGPKVTVDASTLINKGLELMEARWLFDVESDKIDAMIHPQSLLHGMVEFCDGNIIAQMSPTSMKYPIQYALSYPKRLPINSSYFDFLKDNVLEFSSIDEKKFCGFALAKTVLKEGGSCPCYFNAADEVLVSRFLKKEISWKDITIKLEQMMEEHIKRQISSLGDVLAIDKESRLRALSI